MNLGQEVQRVPHLKTDKEKVLDELVTGWTALTPCHLTRTSCSERETITFELGVDEKVYWKLGIHPQEGRRR